MCVPDFRSPPSTPRAHRCTFAGVNRGGRYNSHQLLSFGHCFFEWEQWEQWEHRMNKGSPRSHSLLSSGNSGNKFQGARLFLHIYGSFHGLAQFVGAGVQSPTAPTERQGFCTLVLFTGSPPAARKEPLPAPPTGGVGMPCMGSPQQCTRMHGYGWGSGVQGEQSGRDAVAVRQAQAW